MTTSLATQSHNVLLMPSCTEPDGKQVIWTNSDLEVLIQNPKIQAQKGGQCFTFGTFNYPYRNGGNITGLTAIGLDYDKGSDIQDASQVWREMGLRHWLYTTYSHQSSFPKFRILFPLAK